MVYLVRCEKLFVFQTGSLLDTAYVRTTSKKSCLIDGECEFQVGNRREGELQSPT